MLTFTDETIAQRAYHIWEERQRTGRDGTAESDWLEAKTQLELDVVEERPLLLKATNQ